MGELKLDIRFEAKTFVLLSPGRRKFESGLKVENTGFPQQRRRYKGARTSFELRRCVGEEWESFGENVRSIAVYIRVEYPMNTSLEGPLMKTDLLPYSEH